MSEHAKTQFLQAQTLIKTGEVGHAMDLLQRARMLTKDNELVAQIISEMIRIAPQAGRTADAEVWKLQLARLQSSGVRLGDTNPSPTPELGRSIFRSPNPKVIKGALVLIGLGLLIAAGVWFLRFSASRYEPIPTTASGGSTSAPS